MSICCQIALWKRRTLVPWTEAMKAVGQARPEPNADAATRPFRAPLLTLPCYAAESSVSRGAMVWAQQSDAERGAAVEEFLGTAHEKRETKGSYRNREGACGGPDAIEMVEGTTTGAALNDVHRFGFFFTLRTALRGRSRYRSRAVGYAPTAVGCPPAAVRHPPTVDLRLTDTAPPPPLLLGTAVWVTWAPGLWIGGCGGCVAGGVKTGGGYTSPHPFPLESPSSRRLGPSYVTHC